MFLKVLVSVLALASCHGLGVSRVRVGNQVFERQISSPRGFVNTNTSTATPSASPSSAQTTSADYFALTPDGRLERVQLVFPEGTQVQQAVPATETAQFLLTPDGRLEKLQKEPEVKQVAGYFRLSEDGRLETITEQDIPADAKEENGEYHVLLPSGSLQRVRFMTTTKGNLLSAKVQYQEVQPITGPIYKYANPLVRVV